MQRSTKPHLQVLVQANQERAAKAEAARKAKAEKRRQREATQGPGVRHVSGAKSNKLLLEDR
jgi:hypothetical protein